MTSAYHWHRTEALLRAKVAGARRLIERTTPRDSMAERARRQAALAAAEEHLRIHQMNKPQENES